MTNQQSYPDPSDLPTLDPAFESRECGCLAFGPHARNCPKSAEPGEYNRLGPMIITPERMAVLDDLWADRASHVLIDDMDDGGDNVLRCSCGVRLWPDCDASRASILACFDEHLRGVTPSMPSTPTPPEPPQ